MSDELCDVGMHTCKQIARTLDDGRTVCPECDSDLLDSGDEGITQYHVVPLANDTGFAVKCVDGRIVAAMFAGSPEDLLSARRQAEAACFSLNEISTPDSEKIT